MLSLFLLLSSVLTVVASAETETFPDDMYDDDVNVTYDAGTTATTKGSILDNVPDDGIGGFVGGVVESVFQDEDVSEQVNDKAEGIFGSISGIFDSFKDIIPSTNKQTTGSNFFDPINPVVGGGYTPNTGGFGANNISSTNAAINGESVDYNTTVNPYTKPTATLNPGDKGDGVKWLQWILIYTECGLQNPITGDYDDATAAAVKTLQLKYGMNPDGIASLEVIEKAEQMYNDYINGVVQQGSTGQAVFNTVGSNTNQNNKPEKPVDIKITIIIVVLVIVWIFAIAIVFIIVHIKRKNITLSEDGEIIKPEKKEKNKRRRELQDSRPITSSKTLLSLSDDVGEALPTAEATANDEPEEDDSFEADVSNITLKTEFIEVVAQVEESEEQTEPISNTDEAKPREEINENENESSSETENVSEEAAVAEKTEDAPTETAEDSEGVLKEEDENQSADDFLEAEESTSLDVVDVQEQFNLFTSFDDNYDDDGEMKISSLLEIKQRKAKAQAKDENKNS